MAGTSVVFLALVGLSAALIGVVDANAFLQANPPAKEERISEADVQASLLAEVEGTFGEGSASSRVKQLEAILEPIYAALPKNEQGYLGHATVRYALHRLFVQRHGWVIKGLDAAGTHRNATPGIGLFTEQVPEYIQDLFEERLGGRGLGLRELGVLAATIEHLVHNEAIKRLGDVFKAHKYLATSVMNEREADDVLDTYMTLYVLGDEVIKTPEDALAVKSAMSRVYLAWPETTEFVHAVRRNVTKSEASPEQMASGEIDFALLARAAERVGEQFGSFQDQECQQMKARLINISDQGTGRVRLSEFYKPALDGHWQFQESAGYLRQLGALDESDPAKPRVIISNFVTSPSNCIASSSFYSVCCMDECEGLLGHLEKQIAGPEASPTQIARLVSDLSSSSITAPRTLPPALLDRLEEIAAENGGIVPLHGRLFAQWMHHAFPHECNFPHLAGTTMPQSPSEWYAVHGDHPTASNEEMSAHVKKARQTDSAQDYEDEVVSLPWAPEEELLCRPQNAQSETGSTVFSSLRSFVVFTVMASIAYGLVRNSMGRPASVKCVGVEKFMV